VASSGLADRASSIEEKGDIVMRGIKINWLATFILAFVMAFPLSFALRGQRPGFPEIRAAMQALMAARHHLANAGTNFGGHRAAALAATDNALRECREAIRFARHR
jgi:hypothetical protein